MKLATIGKRTLYLFFLVSLLWCSFCVFAEPLYIKNWKYHPRIKEIRRIVQDVRKKIENGTYKNTVYKYDIDADSCDTSFPIVSIEFAEDDKGRLKFFKLVRNMPEGRTIAEVVFGPNRIARFIYVDWITIFSRYYYAENGGFLFGVDEDNSTYKAVENENHIETTLDSINESGIRKEYINTEYFCPRLP